MTRIIHAMNLQPITFAEARRFLRIHHRHHQPPPSWLFGTAIEKDGVVRGVIVVGRPIARMNDDGYTAEVTRCCTDGVKNGCSMLYRAAWRAARALGYRRLITYTLSEEGGASLRGAGFREIGKRGGGSWSRNGRPRVDPNPTSQKLLWEMVEERP